MEKSSFQLWVQWIQGYNPFWMTYERFMYRIRDTRISIKLRLDFLYSYITPFMNRLQNEPNDLYFVSNLISTE
jgi:hypothetical protein